MFCNYCVYIVHTCNAGVIHQDDLFEHDGRRRVQDAVDRPEERGPGLVVEDDNNTGGGQSRTATELPLNAPERGEPRRNTKIDKEERARGISDEVKVTERSCRATYNRPLFADIQSLLTDTLNSTMSTQSVIARGLSSL